MQRGVQAIVPDTTESSDQRDLFTSPWSSGDFGRRLFSGASRLLPSPTTTLASSLSRTAPQPTQLVTAASTTAVPTPSASHLHKAMNHRRVSLPSIIESPSSPTAPILARQSCDLARISLWTEPLHGRSGSADARLPSPVPFLRLPSQRTISSNSPLQQSSSNPITPLPTNRSSNSSRRRSVDISASTTFLSPKTALAVNRRRSLDQLSCQKRPGETKARRQSNASNAETVVSSGQSSCSTLVNPLTLLNDRNDSRTLLSDSGPISDSKLSAEADEALSLSVSPANRSRVFDSRSCSLASTPQEEWVNDDVTKRRVMSVSELGSHLITGHGRQPLSTPTDIEAIALGLVESKKKYRRRSMQDALWRSSSNSSSHRPIGMSYSISDSSLMQDPMPTPASPATVKQQQQHRKTGSSFSGSATISGRFSRFWSSAVAKAQKEDLEDEDMFAEKLKQSFSSYHHGLYQQCQDVSTGPMTAELETKWITTTTTTSDLTGAKPATRTGVMSRLAGIWSRR